LADTFGICQWFHFRRYRQVEATIEGLAELGVRHLRTGISWADYHRPGGVEWYDWQMRALSEAGLAVLLSVWHTPPSISLDPARRSTAVPPAHTRDFADFIDTIIERWDDQFDALELWNEPNNPYKWDPRYDPDHTRFATLIRDAAHWARVRGKPTVLGGVTHLDRTFAGRMSELGVVDMVDVVACHSFPEMWEPHATDWDHPDHWFGWEHRVEEHECWYGPRVWVTETGFATSGKTPGVPREELQVELLQAALQAPVERLYWYGLLDLDPALVAIEESNGGPREEPEYHMGLIRFNPRYRLSGHEKPAYEFLRARAAVEAVGADS
jgi:CDP-paratose 2-epimerase